jgi:hypothetical protein
MTSLLAHFADLGTVTSAPLPTIEASAGSTGPAHFSFDTFVPPTILPTFNGAPTLFSA